MHRIFPDDDTSPPFCDNLNGALFISFEIDFITSETVSLSREDFLHFALTVIFFAVFSCPGIETLCPGTANRILDAVRGRFCACRFKDYFSG
jgi:hypothetical protein